MKKSLVYGYMILGLMTAIRPGFAAKELVEREPFIYNDAGKRDPFWPLVSEGGVIIRYDETSLSASDMVLMGVMTGADNKNVAVINGKIVKEGDSVGLFKVICVDTDRVILDNGNEDITLQLRKEE